MTQQAESTDSATEYLEELLGRFGDLGPKVERMDEANAEKRIQVEISKVAGDKQQAGLWSIHKVLKEHGVPPSVRLHLVSATVNLSLLAAERRGNA